MINLTKVKPHRLRVIVLCSECDRKCYIGEQDPAVYADLEGEAFKAYYCASCAEAIK